MYHQSNTVTDYRGIERIVLPTNGHFVDPDPTMVYWIRVREAVQAEKIVKVYRRLYGHESHQHVSRKGNTLQLTIEGLSKLEKCARIANVHVNPKDAKINRR